MFDETRLFEQDEVLHPVSKEWVPAGFRPVSPIPEKKRTLSEQLKAAGNASRILRQLLFESSNLSKNEKIKLVVSANKWLRRANESTVNLEDGIIPDEKLIAAFNRVDINVGILQENIRTNRRAGWRDPTLNRWLSGLSEIWEIAGFRVDQGASFAKFCMYCSAPETKPMDDVVSENTIREFIQRRPDWHMRYREKALGETPTNKTEKKSARSDP